MDQKKEKVSVPMTNIKCPPDPYAQGYSSSYMPESYAQEPQTKKSYGKGPQASKSYVPEPQAPKSYTPGLYEPKSYTPDPYGPKSYRSDPYAPKSYSSDPYASTSYSSDPYAPEPSAPEHIEFSDGCSYTIEVTAGDCPSPPPYSSVDVCCDKTGTGCCVVNQPPPVVVAGIFSSEPASTICPCCRQIITTEVVFRVGSLTYALCTCMCMVGCCLGCCLIPFASKCCKDVDHYCPCCRYHIYRYKRL
ncbi:PREDICTED: lipopolysaccharide-induced tumor necrosis factor-alpha factor homolog isoform X2 [Gekko japonicus]|uniref:Lipopolysaccharide-induced tumor necrosis factor-alpha factor homolog isoform X2 n=1 Tax=Gekko japonicus TaxID=146911 RepID=A0ABM1LF71_GEKJA|nr:PREDICTED: lipopolysaccharide-induced tumor necrosis factor-alpha factor homolog isoform X2 [Gekko japonicus]